MIESVTELTTAAAQFAEHTVEVADHSTDQLVAVCESVRNRSGVRQHRCHSSGLALKHLEQGHRQRVDLLRVQGLKQRLETTE